MAVFEHSWIQSSDIACTEPVVPETPRFYRFVNANRKHFDHPYKEGLNVLAGPFNADPTQTCVKGRLYFTEKKFLHKYQDLGVWIYEVFLPKDDKLFQMVSDPAGDKWGANRIILGKKYSVFDLNTYQELDLDFMKFNFFVQACEYGKIDYIREFLERKLYIDYDNVPGRPELNVSMIINAINKSIINNHIDVLDMLYERSPQLFMVHESCMELTFMRANIAVLNWLIRHNIWIAINIEHVIKMAQRTGKLPILITWLNETNFNNTMPVIRKFLEHMRECASKNLVDTDVH